MALDATDIMASKHSLNEDASTLILCKRKKLCNFALLSGCAAKI
jgi:hypothetical protein